MYGKENELLSFLKDLYENDLPFNKLIGLKIKSISLEKVKTEFTMHADLIGNPVQKTLHGGVISSVLDATGGLAASAGIVQRMDTEPVDTVLGQFTKIGTIDLRVDYLRPGRGEIFTAKANIMRSGKKVAVTRMALSNEADLLIAVGTGTYLVG
ncbi:MAG: thioesterase family protein [Desulfobacterales bacterium]|nr:thioesterase family protein [Desulfobacterales bacterium]